MLYLDNTGKLVALGVITLSSIIRIGEVKKKRIIDKKFVNTRIKE